MQPRIDVITLAVGDLERALQFYRRLGLESEGVIGTQYVDDETAAGGAAVMFPLANGLTLALYGREDLAKDAGISVGTPVSGEFSIGHIVSSKAEVDELLARAEAAGATLIGKRGERPWPIYSGYFRDLDGHLWEVICRVRG